MRIGTWNLAGRWTADHLDFVLRLDCDVLLLGVLQLGAPVEVLRHASAVGRGLPR